MIVKNFAYPGKNGLEGRECVGVQKPQPERGPVGASQGGAGCCYSGKNPSSDNVMCLFLLS